MIRIGPLLWLALVALASIGTFQLKYRHPSTLIFPSTCYLRSGSFGKEEGTFGAKGVLDGTVRGAVAGGTGEDRMVAARTVVGGASSTRSAN